MHRTNEHHRHHLDLQQNQHNYFSENGARRPEDCLPTNRSIEQAKIINFQEFGGITDSSDIIDANHNSKLLNRIFEKMSKYSTLTFPEYSKTFYLNGGIVANDLEDVVVDFQSVKLVFQDDIDLWPRKSVEEDPVHQAVLVTCFVNDFRGAS